MSLKICREGDLSFRIDFDGTIEATTRIYNNLSTIRRGKAGGDDVLDLIVPISGMDVINADGANVVEVPPPPPHSHNYNMRLMVEHDSHPESGGQVQFEMNMGLPETSPLPGPGGVQYLEDILTIILNRFRAGDTPSNPNLQTFLLGVLTLTKCR